MKRNLLILIAFHLSVLSSWGQEVKMRDVFAGMPDSILPLITKNNRLDCIDFIENNMPAQVKNKVDESIELTALTENYLKLRMSSVSDAEMKLLTMGDTAQVICLVKTYAGPIKDSSIRFYSMDWKELSMMVEIPDIEAFVADVPESEQNRKHDVVAMLRDMPFIMMSLNPDDEQLTLSLQTGELLKKDREWVKPYLKELRISVK